MTFEMFLANRKIKIKKKIQMKKSKYEYHSTCWGNDHVYQAVGLSAFGAA
jgi:hypothetical protein